MASPVVIDLGSGSCKAGEAAGSAPQLVVPSRVGRAKYGQGAMIGAHPRETWVGHEIEGKEAILIQKEPIHRGVVVNWDDLEHIFRHIFFNLHVDPAEHPVLLTEPALNPKANREKLIHSMFETFGVKRCSLFLQPVLALYSSGRTTGVILDCGDTVTCTVPIYDGFLIESGVQQLDLGGREITCYILKGLQGRNDDCRLSTRMGFKIAENVKESLGFVQCDEVEEGEVSFELPSLESESTQKAAPLRVGAERHLGPEALFQPELQGKEQGGVVEMVWQSVMMADADIQDELLLWIDEKDYDEFGPTLVHERQRFSVTVELVSPEPGSSQAQGISLQGVGTLDLPPGLEREYRFSVYAYHEGSALVRVHLTSQETGEFLNIEVKFDFFAAESLATIKLDAACRQVVRHKIAVANPLMQPARCGHGGMTRTA
ncbi:unnamed protein product [Cladocopium goreaui]|uniref:Actin-5, muscle-specific n=1 Tax=Cladocopium goreaui TaxID=2562237 RepID=A0A9P1BRX6_9DINO|nr:unnamed protein product [Cladocopium goreaui]